MKNLAHLLPSILFFFVLITTPVLSTNYTALFSSSNGGLVAGESLTNKLGYALTLQEDCNLALTGPDSNIIWQTKTWVHADQWRVTLTLQSNGELVLAQLIDPWTGFEETMWSSGVKSEYGDYVLAISPDGVPEVSAVGPTIWSLKKSVGKEANIAMVKA